MTCRRVAQLELENEALRDFAREVYDQAIPCQVSMIGGEKCRVLPVSVWKRAQFFARPEQKGEAIK
jgi:hypothetical protein